MKKAILQYCSTGRKGVKPFFFSRSSVGDPWSGVIFLHLRSSLNDYWIKTLHNLAVKDQIPKTFGSNFSLNLFTISSLMTIEANIIELNQVPKTLESKLSSNPFQKQFTTLEANHIFSGSSPNNPWFEAQPKRKMK